MIAYLKTETEGVALFYRIDDALRAKANIVINHGFAEHLGRYEYVAQKLVAAGYNVLRYDLRGHGQTKGLQGHIDSYHNFITDADAMVDLMKLNNPNLSTYMLGHSMGGLVTTLYGIKYPNKLAGQILSGAANGKLPEASTLKARALSIAAKFTPMVKLKNPVENDICSVPEVVYDYQNDPLVLKKATFNFYNEFLVRATDEVLSHLNEYNLPVLILHGEEDSIVPSVISQHVFDTIASKDKTLHIYPKLYHEIFNEEIKEEIVDYVIDWLDNNIKAVI